MKWSKESFLNKWCYHNGKQHEKKVYLDTDINPFIILNKKWMTDLNGKCKL